MNGTKFFFNTNAIVELLKGNPVVENLLLPASWIGTSVVCIIEFLAFSQLTLNDRHLLNALTHRISVLSIENNLPELEQMAILRRQTRLKLPDAIIAASAMANGAVLVSNDNHFTSIFSLSVISF